MDVKIELQLPPTEFPMVRVTSQDGKVDFLTPLNVPLKGRMNGRLRAYFALGEEDGSVAIGEEVRGASW